MDKVIIILVLMFSVISCNKKSNSETHLVNKFIDTQKILSQYNISQLYSVVSASDIDMQIDNITEKNIIQIPLGADRNVEIIGYSPSTTSNTDWDIYYSSKQHIDVLGEDLNLDFQLIKLGFDNRILTVATPFIAPSTKYKIYDFTGFEYPQAFTGIIRETVSFPVFVNRPFFIEVESEGKIIKKQGIVQVGETYNEVISADGYDVLKDNFLNADHLKYDFFGKISFDDGALFECMDSDSFAGFQFKSSMLNITKEKSLSFEILLKAKEIGNNFGDSGINFQVNFARWKSLINIFRYDITNAKSDLSDGSDKFDGVSNSVFLSKDTNSKIKIILNNSNSGLKTNIYLDDKLVKSGISTLEKADQDIAGELKFGVVSKGTLVNPKIQLKQFKIGNSEIK